MIWFVLIAVIVGAAALFYVQKRRKQQSDLSITIDADTETSFYPEIEKCHEINIKAITCSCDDFRKEREQFRHDDPCRLCKHLVKSFIDANSLPEYLMLYKEGIQRSAENHSGFPADRTRFDKSIGAKRVSIMIPKAVHEDDFWIDVYCEAKGYRYSPESDKWADETAPPLEYEIIRFLYEKIGRPLPEARLNLRKPFLPLPIEHKKKEYKPTDDGAKGLQAIESLLRTLLPPDGELTLRETKNYLVVAFNGSRKWICRIYLNFRKSNHIEFPDGRRYELNGIEDIASYKEELINTYREQSPKKGKARMLFPINEHVPSPYPMTSVERRDTIHLFSRN
jgi:hypothetical protein